MESQQIHAALKEMGGNAALATVIATRGSVPRHAGSKMLIASDGRMVGTIGGGCGEADVLNVARDVSATGKAQMVHVELLDSIDGFDPAVCGGVMDVFVEPIR